MADRERARAEAGGVGEAEVEAGARALARLQVERNMSEREQRDIAHVERCVDASWRDWTEETYRVLEAVRQAADPGAEALRAEVERLTRERDEERVLNRDYRSTPVGQWIARAEAAERMLRQVEWSATADVEDGGTEAACPVCGWAEREGEHAPGCGVAAALSDGGGDADRS